MSVNTFTNYLALFTFAALLFFLFFTNQGANWFEILLGFIVSLSNYFIGKNRGGYGNFIR